MDKKLKNKWIRALRSGEYAKTKEKLVNKKGNSFCCLGVLACVLDAEWDLKTGIAYYKDDLPVDLESTIQYELVNLNDVENKSFKYIADWIQKNVPST